MHRAVELSKRARLSPNQTRDIVDALQQHVRKRTASRVSMDVNRELARGKIAAANLLHTLFHGQRPGGQAVVEQRAFSCLEQEQRAPPRACPGVRSVLDQL